jgi:hypothetical protein
VWIFIKKTPLSRNLLPIERKSIAVIEMHPLPNLLDEAARLQTYIPQKRKMM